MTDFNLYTLGAARVTEADGKQIPPVCHVTLDIDEAAGIREDMGEPPLSMALGLTALPVAPTDAGKAEGVCGDGIGGYTGVCVGARDTRCSDVYGRMKPGETVLHCTGGTPDTRSRVKCAENFAAILVGNDLTISVDRKNSKIMIAGFGHVFEMSTANGIAMSTKGGKCGLQMTEDGAVFLWGTSVCLGGHTTPGTPATAVLMGPAGVAGVPAPNVYITL